MYTHIYIGIYGYMCVCVCVFVLSGVVFFFVQVGSCEGPAQLSVPPHPARQQRQQARDQLARHAGGALYAYIDV